MMRRTDPIHCRTNFLIPSLFQRGAVGLPDCARFLKDAHGQMTRGRGGTGGPSSSIERYKVFQRHVLPVALDLTKLSLLSSQMLSEWSQQRQYISLKRTKRKKCLKLSSWDIDTCNVWSLRLTSWLGLDCGAKHTQTSCI
eukprot:scaffold130649_cov34-Prasinocladus_malaysianus.AAC.2